MGQKTSQNTFKEQYQIRFDYQKEDGYWVISATEDIYIDVIHGDNEKNNHEKAKKAFLKKYPMAKVKLVSYC